MSDAIARAGLAVVLALPAICLAEGFYVGTDMGRGGARLDCRTGGRCEKTAAAAGLRLGYQFTPRWGVEIGLLGIGETHGGLDRGLGLEPGTVRVGAAVYQGTATWELSRWSFTAKLGLADNIGRSSFGDYPTRDRTGVTAAAGLEISYRLSPQWRISLLEEHRPNVSLTAGSHASVNSLTAGVTYGFGR